MPKMDILSVRGILAVACITGAIAASPACNGPGSRGHDVARHDQQPLVLIPNIDDDNGDGVPDVSAAPLAAGTDDDILQIQVFPDTKLPRGAMVRAEIAEPWTRFARVFVRTNSPGGPRFVQTPVEIDRSEARKKGVAIGVEAADFPAHDRPSTIEATVTFETQEGRPIREKKILCAKIDAVRRTLQEGLALADADIVEIPVLFNSDSRWFPGRYFSETVNMVNGLLLGTDYIVPDPRGPLVDGQDVLLRAVKDRLEPLGCRVVPLDCFDPYHRGGGEIHCGTNATRLRTPK